jgi:two-component system sensor histidine kinase KdpD
MTDAISARLAQPARSGVVEYVEALSLVAVSTAAGLVLSPRWGSAAVDLLFLPTVLGVAIMAGRGPALAAATASALAYNYFFTAPYHSLLIRSPADVVTVIVLFLVAIVTSELASSVRAQARLAEAHAARNATIAGLARKLLSCASEQEIADVGVSELAAIFNSYAILLTGPDDIRAEASNPANIQLTPSDVAAASVVFSLARPTGRGISKVSTVEWQLHPVQAGETVLRVVGLARADGLPVVRAEQADLLASLLDQLALAFERARLELDAREFAALRERDRIRSSLVASLGQELNPCLAIIDQNVSAMKRAGQFDKETMSAIGRESLKIRRHLESLVELGPESDQQPIEIGGVRIDIFRRTVTRDGQSVHLSPKEYSIIAELAKHPGRVLSHAHLLKVAWGPAQEGHTEYLRVAVRALRQKLERDPKQPRIILNEPAVGYRLGAG